jgi:autotransporter-associated beta strand protein
VFEFVGATSGVSRTRPLVLNGKGGAIRASGIGSARLGFGDVSALAAGETTLVIDGTNTLFNTISGVRDGAGRVNVVKNGDGDWYLSCSNTFSGDLAVNAGTLTVLGPKYTWFRFTVKQTGNSNYVIAFRQLALYDANGVRQNIGLSVAPPEANDANTTFWPDSDSAGLAPGSFAFGSKTFLVRLYDAVDRWVNQLFGDVTSSNTFPDGTYSGDRFRMRVYKTDDGSTQGIKKSNPNSWIPFVMRLTNGAPEIVSYDILSYWHTSGTNEWPKIATMEASIDGVNWDLVETNDLGEVLAEHNYDFSIPLGGSKNNSNMWFSDGSQLNGRTPSKATTPRPGAGFPIRGRVANFTMPLQNVRSISVAAGATLKTETEVVISSLKVDVGGAGTMDGFTFAETGTINVLTDATSQPIELPGTYVNCIGLENVAGWDIEVNGNRTQKFIPEVVDGHIRLRTRGLVLIYR